MAQINQLYLLRASRVPVALFWQVGMHQQHSSLEAVHHHVGATAHAAQQSLDISDIFTVCCVVSLAGEKGSAAQLARVLRPIMWRNSKRSTAEQGLQLPSRTLTLTRLHFTPAEHTFYSHILEKTREARDALHQHHHHLAGPHLAPSSAQSPAQAGQLVAPAPFPTSLS